MYRHIKTQVKLLPRVVVIAFLQFHTIVLLLLSLLNASTNNAFPSLLFLSIVFANDAVIISVVGFFVCLHARANSEETPFTAMALALCSYDAGFIDGQFSVLPCKNPHTVSKVLLQSSDVRCVTFTGSTSIGKVLYKECAETIKRTQFELGGNVSSIYL